jgi:tetratricopeptide (TPR) repeat protein
MGYSFRIGSRSAESELSIGPAAAHYKAGEHEAAAVSCLEVLARQPRHFDALHLLGVLCCNRGNFADAVGLLRRAERVRPDVGTLYTNLGNAYAGLKLHAEAASACRRMLELSPGEPAALNDLGSALAGLEQPEAAEALFRQALALRPDLAPARYNLARCLAAQNRHAEALAEFRVVLEAVAADPPRQELVAGALASTLGALGRYDEALAVCDAVLADRPGSVPTLWNRSLALLCVGRCAEGFRDYEIRWQVAAHDPTPPDHAVLDVTAVAGRDVLVVTEQGRGDLLHFARYAPLLSVRGAWVTLQAYTDVAPVLTGMPGVRVLTQDDAEPSYDLKTSQMSLPLAFRTTVETIPGEVPYLRVPTGRVEAWRDRLGVRARPRIGLAWAGNPGHSGDRDRSIRLDRLLPLLAAGPAAFHALQKQIGPTDHDWLVRSGVAVHAAALHDFGETAALVSQMDLIITVDTAVAHLAGGLAAPVWVLLPFNADWRWLTERTDCPWYPTMRLFRQPSLGDWTAVIAQVAEALALFLLA